VNGQPVFLGTCERAPRLSLVSHFREVYRDDLGHHVPWDLLMTSEEAYLYCELNRWDEAVLEAAQDRMYRQGTPFPLRGFHTEEAVGSLMRAEEYAYAVTFSLPYSRKLGNALSGAPGNYVFPACVLWGPDDLDPLGGTQDVRKVRLVWRALRYVDDDDSASVLYYHASNLVLPPIN
jgi:hypothetical protein